MSENVLFNQKTLDMLSENIRRVRMAFIDIKNVDLIFHRGYIPSMAWNVEYTDEFEAWWVGLGEEEQIDIAAVVGLLEERGLIFRTPTVRMSKGPSSAQ